MNRFSTLFALVLFASCASTDNRDQTAASRASTEAATPFDTAFVPPWCLVTERMRLEPLRPALVQLDYDAFMSSIDHLRDSLRWENWPSADYELEQNRVDLQRHWDEFGAAEAYAYTVLTPDRSRCIGCVYINPFADLERRARVAYWVTEDQLESRLDEHLLIELVAWFEREWPLDTVQFPTHLEYQRGFDVAYVAGLSDPGVIPLANGEGDPRTSLYWSREVEGAR